MSDDVGERLQLDGHEMDGRDRPDKKKGGRQERRVSSNGLPCRTSKSTVAETVKKKRERKEIKEYVISNIIGEHRHGLPIVIAPVNEPMPL